MNNRKELLKRRRELGITQKNESEEIVIEPVSNQGISGLMAWILYQQLFLPVIEY